MMITYVDYKYDLKSVLMFTFFTITLLVFRISKRDIRGDFRFFNVAYIINILLFLIAFCIAYNLSVYVFFRNIEILKGGEIFTFIEFIKAILIFPIYEEMIFRKILLNYLIERNSIFKSILICSFGFLLVHFLSGSSPLYVFVISCFLCYVYIKTQNIIFCIFCHGLNNLIVLYIVPMLIYQKIYLFIVSTFVLALINFFIICKYYGIKNNYEDSGLRK